MKREEAIYKAAEDYAYTESPCETVASNSFIAGARWADSNPKSPWISVKDDLPFKHKELVDTYGNRAYTRQILVLYNNCPYIISMYRFNSYWYWDTFNKNIYVDKITHWMPIPKYPKEL